MSRVIKFRAWIDSDKQMYEVLQFSDVFPSEDFYRVFIKKEWREGQPMNYRMTGKNALMQFTGLQDKNGKDIYEGDIVRIYWTSDDGDYTDCRVYHNTKYAYVSYVELGSGGEGNPICELVDSRFEVEIISNIYEHPELLTQLSKKND